MPEIELLEEGSSTQRGGLNHQAIEDYLKTIFALAQNESPVTTSRLAEARQVKPASATGMIRRLAELNLVNYEKHRGVTLTSGGEKIALEVIRHHRLIELYLIRALGFSWDEVHEQADILEHVISEKLEERIAIALGNPQFDPHGAPIPTKDGQLPLLRYQRLSTLTEGETRRVSRIINDEDGELLRYLASIGLELGSIVTVQTIGSLESSLVVLLNHVEQVLPFQMAQVVLVEPLGS